MTAVAVAEVVLYLDPTNVCSLITLRIRVVLLAPHNNLWTVSCSPFRAPYIYVDIMYISSGRLLCPSDRSEEIERDLGRRLRSKQGRGEEASYLRVAMFIHYLIQLRRLMTHWRAFTASAHLYHRVL